MFGECVYPSSRPQGKHISIDLIDCRWPSPCTTTCISPLTLVFPGEQYYSEIICAHMLRKVPLNSMTAEMAKIIIIFVQSRWLDMVIWKRFERAKYIGLYLKSSYPLTLYPVSFILLSYIRAEKHVKLMGQGQEGIISLFLLILFIQSCCLRVERVHVGISNCYNINFWLCLVV